MEACANRILWPGAVLRAPGCVPTTSTMLCHDGVALSPSCLGLLGLRARQRKAS